MQTKGEKWARLDSNHKVPDAVPCQYSYPSHFRLAIRLVTVVHKSSAGPCGDTAHTDKDTSGLFPVVVFNQSLEHTSGFNGKDEFCLALELEVFDFCGD